MARTPVRRILGLGRGALGNDGGILVLEARNRGHLVLRPDARLTRTNQNLAAIWSWWCVAAKRPEAIVDLRSRVLIRVAGDAPWLAARPIGVQGVPAER